MQTAERTTTSPLDEWRAGLAGGQLLYQLCPVCPEAIFYPRVACPRCGSDDLRFAASSGSGTVYSATAGHSRSGSYSIAMVDLDEGFRLFTSVRGIDPEQVHIGMRVTLQIVEEDGTHLPVFTPAEMIA